MFVAFWSSDMILHISAKLTFCTVLFYSISYTFSLRAREIEFILNYHNNLRRNYALGRDGHTVSNMNKLVWDRLLFLQAENTVSCNEDFISHEESIFDIHINKGATLNGNISSFLRSWTEEEHKYIPEYETCMDLDECKHFFKMINAKQQRIGCAFKEGCTAAVGEVNVLLCLYSGGDLITPPFQRGNVCTRCSEPYSFCDNGLCVPCDAARNETCDCRKTCAKAGIGVGELDPQTCTCSCSYGLGPNCDEDCVNPPGYIDFDICEMVTEADCHAGSESDRAILREFCPTVCACRRHPLARLLSNHTASLAGEKKREQEWNE